MSDFTFELELKEKLCKFKGKSKRDCYKLIWQWVKEGSITFPLFQELCDAVARRSDSSDSNVTLTPKPVAQCAHPMEYRTLTGANAFKCGLCGAELNNYWRMP